MAFGKKFVVLISLATVVVLALAASKPPEKPEWKNLKIIPASTDDEQMDRIMYSYSSALGVTCSHCHPDTKPNVFPRRVDFITDEKPEKKIARDMMRMTARINKKYFNYTSKFDEEDFPKAVISCKTCHRGLPKPSNISLAIP
jgi:hypothetical protein